MLVISISMFCTIYLMLGLFFLIVISLKYYRDNL